MGSPKRAPRVGPTSPAVESLLQKAQREWDHRREMHGDYGVRVEPRSQQITVRDAIAPWYQNSPGGFDGAVAGAQDALKEYGVDSKYGMWPAGSVDKKIPVQARSTAIPGDFSAEDAGDPGKTLHGLHHGETGAVHLNDAEKQHIRGTLDHELTHALMVKHLPRQTAESAAAALKAYRGGSLPSYMVPNLQAIQADFHRVGPVFRGPESSPFKGDWFTPKDDDYLITHMMGADSAELVSRLRQANLLDEGTEKKIRGLVEHFRYLTNRSETYPQVADIRRRYAFDTGKPVRTVADAAQAWDWWRSAQEGWHASPQHAPSLTRDRFGLLDRLPTDAKKAIFTRMTQVPAVLGGLIGAAGQEESQ